MACFVLHDEADGLISVGGQNKHHFVESIGYNDLILADAPVLVVRNNRAAGYVDAAILVGVFANQFL